MRVRSPEGREKVQGENKKGWCESGRVRECGVKRRESGLNVPGQQKESLGRGNEFIVLKSQLAYNTACLWHEKLCEFSRSPPLGLCQRQKTGGVFFL